MCLGTKSVGPLRLGIHSRARQTMMPRLYHVERHSSLQPIAWIISTGNLLNDFKAARLASALGIPCKIKHTAKSPLPQYFQRKLVSARSFLWPNQDASSPSALRYIKQDSESAVEDAESLPRMIIGASNESLPAMFEVKERSGGRTLSIFMGLPDAKLSLFDALVLSRLDQMQLRYLGPARAELDNATSTLLPVSGATTADIALDADIPPKYVAVCIGSGAHLAGYHMQTDHLDILAEGLLHIPSELGIRILLSSSAPKNIRYAIERHLIRKLQHTGGVNAEVIDYSAPSTRQLPPPTHVIAAASHVIVTPDDIASMSLAVSLQKPTYIAGEESTKHILRNYYRLLDTSNLVRRFYPKGSRHSYMLIPDISGEIDEFSAIRDHEPWAKYDAHADLQRAVSFTQARFHALVNHPSPS